MKRNGLAQSVTPLMLVREYPAFGTDCHGINKFSNARKSQTTAAE